MITLPEFINQSTWTKVLNFLSNTGELPPYLLMDKEIITAKASLIGKLVDNSHAFYAVKANPDRQLVEILEACGIGFEVASEGELDMLMSMGIVPERIITSNTVKTPRFIERAFRYGVRYFAFDSDAEIRKLAQYAPSSYVYVRLSVPNEGSEWPLSKKFGVEIESAYKLLLMARGKGLDPAGITFHVGSQCTNIDSWDSALSKVKLLWDMAASNGFKLKLINIGGGYPINYTKYVVDIPTIEKRVNRILNENFPKDIEIFIEPGRAIVGDAGIFVSTVIGKAERGDENWLYIDLGVFSGLMESVGGIKYTYIVESNNAVKKWTVAGPTCDSFDVMDRAVELPEPEVGGRLIIIAGGAYTTSYASVFNGFSVPKTILI
ncbi:MAG: type III PLP-dependent enzyme [Desulfobacterales bacterium]